MANTSSAKKMTRKIAKRTAINRSRRSRMRTFLRKVEEAIAGGNPTTPPPRSGPPSPRSCAPPRRDRAQEHGVPEGVAARAPRQGAFCLNDPASDVDPSPAPVPGFLVSGPLSDHRPA
jgi:small subunit ribosomal protein S20